jgi:hypothetical protein
VSLLLENGADIEAKDNVRLSVRASVSVYICRTHVRILIVILIKSLSAHGPPTDYLNFDPFLSFLYVFDRMDPPPSWLQFANAGLKLYLYCWNVGQILRLKIRYVLNAFIFLLSSSVRVYYTTVCLSVLLVSTVHSSGSVISQLQ